MRRKWTWDLTREMKRTELYLGFGSNEGDRAENIRRAVALMDGFLGVRHSAISEIIETQAWHFDGNRFFNFVVSYDIPDAGQDPALYCLGVLRYCKQTEHQLGRKDKEEYGADGDRVYHNRPIDVDIILYGGYHIETKELCVPHRLAPERDFVLIPLRQIASNRMKQIFPWITGI